MLIFLDAELTNLIDREMISIGMVTEDGQHKLYLEVQDFDQSKCNAFVKSFVLPQLGYTDEACVHRVDVQDRLRDWFSMLPRSVTIACDSQVDREVLIREFGGECPNNLSGWFDLRPLIDTGVYHCWRALNFDQVFAFNFDQGLHVPKSLGTVNNYSS